MCSHRAATAACSPKDIYVVDSPKEQQGASWLRKVRQSGEYSNVSVVVESQTFHLHMLPLLQESTHLKEIFNSRGVLKDQLPGSTEMAVELNNFPGGAAIFSKAMDFCYNIDVKLSASNVAALIAASKYLGMENLLKKADDFLEKSVYKNWRNCLILWASIDHKDPYLLYNCRLNEVTKRCERGFLDCIATKSESSGLLRCNILDIREMLALSSPTLAARVFQTLVEERVILNYASGNAPDSAPNSILLYQPCSDHSIPVLHLDSQFTSTAAVNHNGRFTERWAWKSVSERNSGDAIVWLKALPSALTSDWQRAMFYRYIGEWMMQGMEFDSGNSPPLVLEGFLLSVHVEATKLLSKSLAKQFPGEFMSVMTRLQTFQSLWLLRVDFKWLATTVSRSEIEQFPFEILLAIAQRLSEVYGKNSHRPQQQQQQHQSHQGNGIAAMGGGGYPPKTEKLMKTGNTLLYADKAVAAFEESLIYQLKRKMLSADQVLTLLQEFPAGHRNSHESLYRAVEQVAKLRHLTAAEQHDINKILDYRMVSDEVVKSAFRHPKLGFNHSLLSRAMELEISKLDRVRLHYDQDEDCLLSREQLICSRKCHLILEKALRTHMRASMLLSERYQSLEEKVDALSRTSS